MIGLHPKDLIRHVIVPSLSHLAQVADEPRLGPSPDAVALLLGTAAAESGLRHLKQVGGGPALGLWQMEPATLSDLLANYLEYRPKPLAAVNSLAGDGLDLDRQVPGNLLLACACARLHYWRVPEPLPFFMDDLGQADYWKRYYNTAAGAGTQGHYIETYDAIVKPLLGLIARECHP